MTEKKSTNAFFVKKEDKYGFKSINIPKQINTLTFYFAFEHDKEISKYLGERLRLNLIYEGLKPNSSEYFAGDYYLKNVNGNEYYALDSKNVQGLYIAYRYGDITEIKSALYIKKENKLLLKMAYNTNDGSTHDSKTFDYENEEIISDFSKGDLDDFKEKFFREAYECDDLNQVINIDNLRDVIFDKTARVLS